MHMQAGMGTYQAANAILAKSNSYRRSKQALETTFCSYFTCPCKADTGLKASVTNFSLLMAKLLPNKILIPSMALKHDNTILHISSRFSPSPRNSRNKSQILYGSPLISAPFPQSKQLHLQMVKLYTHPELRGFFLKVKSLNLSPLY